MILSHARGKKHKLHEAFASFDTHAHIASGTRQITDFFYQSESVHSSTAETTFLIRMFNVHVKRLICAHSKSP